MSNSTTAFPASIPCLYSGVTMRSRLESRWAAFFDALQTPWEYEARRYTMPGQHAYTPDFHLTDLAIILEVKPKPVVDSDLADKYAAYGPELIGRGVCNLFVFVVGFPRPDVSWAAFCKHGERSWSFDSVFGEAAVEHACQHADSLRIDARENAAAVAQLRLVRAADEADHQKRLVSARAQFDRLKFLTPEQIAAEFEART